MTELEVLRELVEYLELKNAQLETTIQNLRIQIEKRNLESSEYTKRLESFVEVADNLRQGIREAGVKRNPKLYTRVMSYDAARALLKE